MRLGARKNKLCQELARMHWLQGGARNWLHLLAVYERWYNSSSFLKDYCGQELFVKSTRKLCFVLFVEVFLHQGTLACLLYFNLFLLFSPLLVYNQISAQICPFDTFMSEFVGLAYGSKSILWEYIYIYILAQTMKFLLPLFI